MKTFPKHVVDFIIFLTESFSVAWPANATAKRYLETPEPLNMITSALPVEFLQVTDDVPSSFVHGRFETR